MSIIARQSTARIVTVGPVLDATGVAVTDGVVGDFKIAKNGGAPAALNGSATLTHRNTGHYSLSLTATDLDTVGQAEIVIDDTVNSCGIKEITIVEEAVYDALFVASATGMLPANVIQLLGTAWLTPAVAGTPDVNAKQFGGAAVTATTSVTIPAASTLATTAGAVGSVTGAVGSVTGAVGSVTGNVGGNVVGSVGSVTGAVGSVTGAVGSVTGNVGGNVTGSVGSVATGGITTASFAAGAINAAAIATDAIGSDEISAAAVTKIQTGLATPTNITAATGITVSTNNDKTGYSLTATTGLGNQTANITGNLSGSVGSVTNGVTISGTTTTLDALQTALNSAHGAGSWATATGFSTHSAADVWSVGTRTITGGSLTTAPPTAAAIADAVWDEERSGHVAAGTFGFYLDAAISGITSGGGSSGTGTTFGAAI